VGSDVGACVGKGVGIGVGDGVGKKVGCGVGGTSSYSRASVVVNGAVLTSSLC